MTVEVVEEEGKKTDESEKDTKQKAKREETKGEERGRPARPLFALFDGCPV